MTRSALASRAARSPRRLVGPSTIRSSTSHWRELRHPLDLVGDGAELLVEDDLVELLRLLLERDLEVVLPEEAGVGEPGGEHLAVAVDDRLAAVLRLDIGDADEIRRQLALRTSVQREIFLVGPHGELDHLARHVEEGGVEAAEQRHRPFGEAGILDHQALVVDQAQPGIRRPPRRRPRGSSARAPRGSTMTWQARSFSA